MRFRMHDHLPGATIVSGRKVGHVSVALRTAQGQMLRDLGAGLSAPDQRVLTAFLVGGVPTAAIAASLQCSRRTVTRRVHKLLQRMNSPTYLYVLRQGSLLSRRQREVAKALFLEGQSIRQAARATGESIHYVRRTRRRIQMLSQPSMLEVAA